MFSKAEFSVKWNSYISDISNPYPAKLIYINSLLTHLKLSLATATHNFKWVEITNIKLILAQIFASLEV